LDGPGEATVYYRTKTVVRGEIAEKVNAKFSTYEDPINLDASHIKNKIDTMKKAWKKANNARKSTGNGDLPFLSLRDKMKMCHFYYILEDLWSQSFSLNPRKPCRLTYNLACLDDADAVEDAGVESEDWDQSFESSSSRISKDPAQPKASKKRDSGYIVNVLQELSNSSLQDQELKRRKLDLEERNLVLQERLVEAQIRKLEIEADEAKAKVELQRLRIALEMKRLDAASREA
jgi:hypothetical protein